MQQLSGSAGLEVEAVPELIEGRYLLRADAISLAFRLGRPLFNILQYPTIERIPHMCFGMTGGV